MYGSKSYGSASYGAKTKSVIPYPLKVIYAVVNGIYPIFKKLTGFARSFVMKRSKSSFIIRTGKINY